MLEVLQLLTDLARNASTRAAVAGDGNGNVAVSGRANYFYARLGGADGDVVEVHSAVTPAEDEVILIQRDTGGDLAQWRVVFRL